MNALHSLLTRGEPMQTLRINRQHHTTPIYTGPQSSVVRRQRFTIGAILFALLLAPLKLIAHENHHHDDVTLNTLDDLGDVNFVISCDDEAQNAMNVGLALIHHMMYAQAESHFLEWMESTPHCAMMYWGYSMTLFHPLWPDKISDDALSRGSAALTAAKGLEASEREHDFIDAASAYYDDWKQRKEGQRIENWADAQKALYEKYPKDVDALAFYALSLLVTAPKNDPEFSQNKAAGELLASIYNSKPRHPGALHYTIHAYDNPALAELAIEPARAYDKIAPDVPHALHMPSHIFVRLGMWGDAIDWNSRSAKAALKYPTKNQTSMHYAHALDYLVYAYLQEAEYAKANAVIRNMQTHHPMQANFPVAYALSTIPARASLEQKQWEIASQLAVRSPAYIQWDNFPQVEAITYFSRGIGAARNNDVAGAQAALKQLNTLYEKTLTSSPDYWAVLVDAQRKSVSAWLLYAHGEKKKALDLMRTAADLEDSVDKNPVTPGAVLPARELLGDMLLLEEEYVAALEAYQECLQINRGRLNSLEGVQLAQAGMQANL